MVVLTIHKILRSLTGTLALALISWRNELGEFASQRSYTYRNEDGRFKVLHPNLYPIVVCIQSDCYAWRGKRYFPKNFRFRRNCQHPRAGDGTTLFVTLWEFEVKPGSEELFERTYGPEGEWASLFRRDGRYRGTRLLRDVGRERIYVTVDEWESRRAYEEFKEKFAAEYAELDRKCTSMTEKEGQVECHEV